MLPKHGVNAVRTDHDIAFGNGAVGERHPRDFAMPLKAGAAVIRVHHAGRQGLGQHVDQIGAVHAVGRVPARRIRDLNAGDDVAVVVEVARIVADLGAPFLDRWAEPHALQLAHAVRRDVDAGADLAQRGGLLVHRHPQTLRDQRVRREQAADSATDDDNAGPR